MDHFHAPPRQVADPQHILGPRILARHCTFPWTHAFLWPLWKVRHIDCERRSRVKPLILLLLTLFSTPQIIAQQYGSKFRKDYEKEKNGPHGECRTSWSKLQSGFDYRAIRCLGDEDDLDLHVVRIDLDRWDVDAVVVDRATSRSVARSRDASFGINANFFDSHRNPIGAVIRDGDVVNAPHESSWQSIFLIDDEGTPRIVMPSSWKKYREQSQMAVQAGPRLVIGGHLNRSIKNNYAAARCGVCIKKNGSLIFFATPADRKLHITEIAKAARRDEIDGGLACHDAMLFDGGHSVNFFAEGDDRRISIEGDAVPVHIFAKRHRSSDSDSQSK